MMRRVVNTLRNFKRRILKGCGNYESHLQRQKLRCLRISELLERRNLSCSENAVGKWTYKSTRKMKEGKQIRLVSPRFWEPMDRDEATGVSKDLQGDGRDDSLACIVVLELTTLGSTLE